MKISVIWCFIFHLVYSFSPLDDDILFDIIWHPSGTKLEDLVAPGQQLNPSNSYQMSTAIKEHYTCVLPSQIASDEEKVLKVNKDNAPHVLLAPLFKSETCAYRVESYWTFEVCYSKHVRQYHEERVRGNVKASDKDKVTVTTEQGAKLTIQANEEENELIQTTEYFLGYLNLNVDSKGVLLNPPSAPKNADEVPYKKINGISRPYYAVEMNRGTACDLKPGTNRATTLVFVCSSKSFNEIVSVTETSTCQYEVVIFTPYLCGNPLYRIQEKEINKIQCVADEGSPIKPKALANREESVMNSLNQQNILQTVINQAMQASEVKNLKNKAAQLTMEKPQKPIKVTNSDKIWIKDFFSGLQCLHGGSGWWRFEFCYLKFVNQYHHDSKTGVKTNIKLGEWDETKHLEWTKKNYPLITQKNGEIQGVKQLYTNGDFCEASSTNRQVIVKLICKKNSKSDSAVAMHLREPSVCSYVLTIESSMICDFTDAANEHGLIEL